MSEISSLSVTAREGAGKGAARAVRRAGMVPGVIYGDKKAPTLINLNPRDLHIEMQKPGFFTRVFTLKLDGKTERTLCRDLQRHPVSERVLHVDFQRLTVGAKVHVAVPVTVANEQASPGIKRGGVLNLVEHSVELVGQPENIPAAIIIDLTGKEIGESVHLSQLVLPAGVRPLITDHDITIVAIVAPSGMKAEEEEVVAEVAAPATE